MGAISSLATTGLELAMAKKKQKTEAKAAAQDRDVRTQQLLASAAEDRQNLDATLKRRLAQERARAGAAGVGETGGSIDAVLQGLTEDTNAEQQARSRQLKTSLAGVNATYGQSTNRSLLSYDSRLLSAGSSALGGLTRRSLLD